MVKEHEPASSQPEMPGKCPSLHNKYTVRLHRRASLSDWQTFKHFTTLCAVTVQHGDLIETTAAFLLRSGSITSGDLPCTCTCVRSHRHLFIVMFVITTANFHWKARSSEEAGSIGDATSRGWCGRRWLWRLEAGRQPRCSAAEGKTGGRGPRL